MLESSWNYHEVQRETCSLKVKHLPLLSARLVFVDSEFRISNFELSGYRGMSESREVQYSVQGPFQLWISPICELYWYSGTPVSDRRLFSSYEVRLSLDDGHVGYRLPRSQFLVSQRARTFGINSSSMNITLPMASPRYEVKIRSIETAREYCPSNAQSLFVSALLRHAQRDHSSSNLIPGREGTGCSRPSFRSFSSRLYG